MWQNYPFSTLFHAHFCVQISPETLNAHFCVQRCRGYISNFEKNIIFQIMRNNRAKDFLYTSNTLGGQHDDALAKTSSTFKTDYH